MSTNRTKRGYNNLRCPHCSKIISWAPFAVRKHYEKYHQNVEAPVNRAFENCSVKRKADEALVYSIAVLTEVKDYRAGKKVRKGINKTKYGRTLLPGGSKHGKVS